MALSQEEKQIVEYGKSKGKSETEILTAVTKYRQSQPLTQTPQFKAPQYSGTSILGNTNIQPVAQPQKETPVSDAVVGFNKAIGLGDATNVLGTELARRGIGTDTPKEIVQANTEKPTKGQIAGAVAQSLAIPVGVAVTGGSSLAGQVAAGAGLGYAYDVGQDLIDKKTTKEVVTPGMGTAVGALAPLAITGAGAVVGGLRGTATKVAEPIGNAISGAATKAVDALPDSNLVKGATQTAADIAERIPRFVGRVSDNVQEQAVKSQRIKTSTPAVGNALKVDLPEAFVQAIPNATPEAKAAFKRVLDIADAPKTTMGQKSNPGIVAGELATDQYGVIDKQRKFIGDKIGQATKAMSRTEQVDMRPAYSQLDNILTDQGIKPVYGTKGVELDFSRSNLAPKQRQVVKDLYKLATEAGDSLSPYEIHKKDQLFSAIQREARADQVADVRIELPDGGTTDMFRAFRDVYSNQLDTLSPEIKDLNKKYRNIVTLQDDIENSIFKTPNFEITKATDPAEFAKVNLRRIFGESQSSPAYEAIADEMDAISRLLGYKDASPKEVAAFAQEIRQLYPDTIPKTGFQGGISGVLDIASKALGAGKADTRDQQKALRALLDEK